MDRASAILLLGPTGAGKTPLGDYLEAHGLWGRRCAHFDFGAQLRDVAAGRESVPELTANDLAVITRSLRTGALLEDQQFPIAAGILMAFARRRNIGLEDRIILNGLPRHAGQARDVDGIVRVVAVISLECSAEVVCERIRLNSGGDRAGRVDDDLDAIANKLRIYAERTAPLVEHYRERGVAVKRVTVEVGTTAREIRESIVGC